MGREKNRTGMARHGINVEHAFGISVCHLRKADHSLALALRATGNHEARLLACFYRGMHGGIMAPRETATTGRGSRGRTSTRKDERVLSHDEQVPCSTYSI